MGAFKKLAVVAKHVMAPADPDTLQLPPGVPPSIPLRPTDLSGKQLVVALDLGGWLMEASDADRGAFLSALAEEREGIAFGACHSLRRSTAGELTRAIVR